MASYNPAIPQGNENLSDSQDKILVNFGQLNTQFGVDHTAFNTGSGNGDGFHKKVTITPVQGSDPGNVGGRGVLYTKSVTRSGETFAELYYKSTSSPSATNIVTQLTGVAASAATSGTTPLPGGLILKWGQDNFSGTSVGLLAAFASPFPNFCFQVVAVMSGQQTAVSVDSFNTSGFNITRASGSVSGALMRYIAIGN